MGLAPRFKIKKSRAALGLTRLLCMDQEDEIQSVFLVRRLAVS